MIFQFQHPALVTDIARIAGALGTPDFERTRDADELRWVLELVLSTFDASLGIVGDEMNPPMREMTIGELSYEWPEGSLFRHLLQEAIADVQRQPDAADYHGHAERIFNKTMELVGFAQSRVKDLMRDQELQALAARHSAEWRQRETARELRLVRSAREDAETSASAAGQAAGRAGDSALEQHFDGLASGEQSTADALRKGGVGVLAAVTAAVIAFLVLGERDTSGAVEVAAHLAIALPGYTLSGYLLAESSRHRRTAQWASALKVQLQTVGAYTRTLDAEGAREARLILARRAFGDETSTETAGAAAANIAALVDSMVQAVRRPGA